MFFNRFDYVQILKYYADYGIILSKCLSKSPEHAIDNLIKKNGIHSPYTNGSNVSEIVMLRDLIHGIVTKEKHLNALALVACHTHWKRMKPIVYIYDVIADSYIIGLHKLNKDVSYYPVSFVYNNGKLLPYEWIADIAVSNKNEFQTVYGYLYQLESRLKYFKVNLDSIGLSIDFRFKKSIFSKSKPTMEDPIDDITSEFYGFSKITTLQKAKKENRINNAQQVAWHAFSDKMLELNAEELVVLNKYREFLGKSKNPIQLLKDIEIKIK
jgi:hypothetical protein